MKKSVCYEVLLAIDTLGVPSHQTSLVCTKFSHDRVSGLQLLVLLQTMQRYVLAVLRPRSRQGV